MSEYIKFQNMTIEEMTLMLYEMIVHTSESVVFGFDTRKRVSVRDRAIQAWYSLTLVECEEVLVAVIVTDQGKELESQVIHTKVELDEFVEDYCQRHNNKYVGKICVDIGSWNWHQEMVYMNT